MPEDRRSQDGKPELPDLGDIAGIGALLVETSAVMQGVFDTSYPEAKSMGYRGSRTRWLELLLGGIKHD
jgi:hypothetical protein